MHSLPWAFPDHLGSVLCVCEQWRIWWDCTCAKFPLSLSWSLMLRIGCMWVGNTLTRLHLCTVSPEPSLTIYAPYWVYVSRKYSDKTALVHSLPWAFPDYLCSVYCVYGSNEESDETTLVLSLLWAFAGHLCSVLGVCEQGRFWRDYTCARSPVSLLRPLMLRIGCMWVGKILTRLYLCTVSPEPSRTTYEPYWVYVSREDSD